MTVEQHLLQQQLERDEDQFNDYAIVAIDVKNAFTAFSTRQGMEGAIATIIEGTVDGQPGSEEERCPAATTKHNINPHSSPALSLLTPCRRRS